MKHGIETSLIFAINVGEEEIDEYKKREEREKPMRKIFKNGFRHCPKCDYVVDHNVPFQRYCDRCGQRLSEGGVIYEKP